MSGFEEVEKDVTFCTYPLHRLIELLCLAFYVQKVLEIIEIQSYRSKASKCNNVMDMTITGNRNECLGSLTRIP